MSHIVILTALPHGIVPNQRGPHGGPLLQLSVLVAPRLAAGTKTLASTPFAAWPTTLSRMTFSVSAGSSGQLLLPATLTPALNAQALTSMLTVWSKIFGTAAADAYASKKYESSATSSFSASTIAETITQIYTRDIYDPATTGNVGVGPTGRMRVTKNSALAAHLASLALAVDGADDLASSLRTPQPSGSDPKPNLSGDLKGVQGVSDKDAELQRAAVFFDYKQCRTGKSNPKKGATPSAGFHQIVGQLADHPQVLRQLGLIFDLQFEGDTSWPDNFDVQVVPTLGAGVTGLDVRGPWTKCYFSATEFRAYSLSADPKIDSTDSTGDQPTLLTADGLLPTDPAHFRLDNVDVDHAAIQFVSSVASMADEIGRSDDNVGVELALPALRTAGFALHHNDRERHVGEKFVANYTYNRRFATNESVVKLYAEDLVRGYRVDVSSQPKGAKTGGDWKSLCKRTTTFGIDGVTADGDEGYVKAAAMSTDDSGATVPLYTLHESLFHWYGWSLVGSKPGKAVHAADVNGQLTTTPADNQSSGALLNTPLSISVTPVTGWPKLRFGSSYALRVRAVDLVGSDMGQNLPTTPAADVLRTPYTRYEPVVSPTLVLRRAVTEGESVEHMVIRSDPYGPAPIDAATWAAANTVPKMGMNPYFATCERHVAPPKVAFALAEYHGMFDALFTNPQRAWAVASKESGTFLDASVVDSSVSPLGANYTQPARVVVMPPGTAPPAVDPKRGDGLPTGHYVTYDTPEIMIPYLPDPMARALAINGLGADVVTRTFAPRAAGKAWPELGVFRLVLQSSSSGQVETSGLDSGNRVPAGTAPLVVGLPAGTMLSLTYGSTVADPQVMALNPGANGSLDAAIAKGKYPTISPTRKLMLVHAVQHPQVLRLGKTNFTVAQRGPGETAATITGTLPVDGQTTSHLDFVAAWDEYVDDVRTVPVDPSTNPVAHKAALAAMTVAYGDQSADLPKNLRQIFGDTKHREVRYSMVATSRYREYFPASITSNADNVTSKSIEVPVTVPATARPPAPSVLYAVPSFKWVDNGKTRTRTGAIRVYCDRGWFASGEGERLAIVLADPAMKSQTANLSQLVTAWGQDPIWSPTSAPLSPLTLADVVSSKKDQSTGVALAESPDLKVAVVTFAPNFNMERQLWYFDIELNTRGAYFPFVRLALARYQPSTVGDLRLSRVVRADFAQVSAARTASIVAASATQASVTLVGPARPNIPNATPAQVASGHYATAEVQTSATGGADPLEWITSGSPVLLALATTSDFTLNFQGQLALPTLPSGTKARVLLKEYELYRADAQAGVASLTTPVQLGGDPVPAQRRLVYADTIGL
jgi:hypothetical protein